MGEVGVNVEGWRESYVSNVYSEKGDAIHTAAENRFYNGYTRLDFYRLEDGVEGYDLMMTYNLRSLLGYEDALKSGKRVDVLVRYKLTADRSDFEAIEVMGVEVVDRDFDREEGRE